MLPHRLFGHEMVRIGYDLIVIGGFMDGDTEYSGSLFKLTCANHSCQWDTLDQELIYPRSFFVAVAVPDDFVQCN